VQQFIDFLVSISEMPFEIEDQFGSLDREGILKDYWLFGWVVVDTEEAIIYDPGDIKVTAVPGSSGVKIAYKGEDITDHATLIARRTSQYDLLGHGALECLAGAKESFRNSFGSAWSFPVAKE